MLNHMKNTTMFLEGLKNIFTCISKILTDLLNTSAFHGDQALTKSWPGQPSSPDILRAHLAKPTVTTEGSPSQTNSNYLLRWVLYCVVLLNCEWVRTTGLARYTLSVLLDWPGTPSVSGYAQLDWPGIPSMSWYVLLDWAGEIPLYFWAGYVYPQWVRMYCWTGQVYRLWVRMYCWTCKE